MWTWARNKINFTKKTNKPQTQSGALMFFFSEGTHDSGCRLTMICSAAARTPFLIFFFIFYFLILLIKTFPIPLTKFLSFLYLTACIQMHSNAATATAQASIMYSCAVCLFLFRCPTVSVIMHKTHHSGSVLEQWFKFSAWERFLENQPEKMTASI